MPIQRERFLMIAVLCCTLSRPTARLVSASGGPLAPAMQFWLEEA